MKSENSIYCKSSHGPFTFNFGCQNSMRKFYFSGNAINEYYNSAGEIIKFDSILLQIKKHYGIYELEVFKITKE